MIYRIRFLPETICDRNDILSYLLQYHESTANKFFSLLHKKINQIKIFPYSCPIYEDDPDYRKMVVGDYLVFYQINENDKSIEVHRIFHGSRDIKPQLGHEQ